MFEVLKTEKFNFIFSFLIGFAIFAITIPMCKGDECIIKKAPSIEDMKKHTYKIGKKCYHFKASVIPCPANESGVIEAFQKSRA
jgi:hypothetical protein